MKGNVSGYVCNHGFPSGERDTASSRLCAMLRTQASDEEVDDVFFRRPLYCGRAGSDVIGFIGSRHGGFTIYTAEFASAKTECVSKEEVSCLLVSEQIGSLILIHAMTIHYDM